MDASPQGNPALFSHILPAYRAACITGSPQDEQPVQTSCGKHSASRLEPLGIDNLRPSVSLPGDQQIWLPGGFYPDCHDQAEQTTHHPGRRQGATLCQEPLNR